MPYSLNKKYHFISHAGSGSCLNVYGNETVSNGSNVCVWSKVDGANSQGWEVRNFSGGEKIVTSLNPAYALDFWRGSGNYANCDMYIEAGNDTDSCVVFVAVDSANNIYRIKLKHHNYYLTAKGTSNNSDVRWEELVSSGTTQQWKLVEWPTIPVTELIMPVNLNQKYTGYTNWINKYGCGVCCMTDAASYYANKAYTLADMYNAGAYTEQRGAIWVNAPSVNFTENTQSTNAAYFTKIRSEINAYRPVLILCKNNNAPVDYHWTVAYGYEGAGDTASKIKVLDPAGTPGPSQIGALRSLSEAMAYNLNTTIIDKLRLTSRKY